MLDALRGDASTVTTNGIVRLAVNCECECECDDQGWRGDEMKDER